MKISLRTVSLVTLIMTLGYAQGCVNVSYKGASYPPTEKIEIVKKQKGVPPGYTVMGKAVATAPSEEGSRQEMENKIIEKAKSEGADAVMIVLFELVKIGEERDDEFMGTSYDNAGWGMNVDTEGDTRQMDYSHTGTTPSERMDTPVYKSVMKAVFLKKK